MSNMHRIAWLDSRIRAERYPNCRELSEKFEISIRQAQRDTEYLKYTMGAPLEYSATEKGYYYKDLTFSLPAVMISDEEKQMLSYIANRYKSIGGSDVSKLASLFDRLVAGDKNYAYVNHNLPVLQFTTDEARNYNILQDAFEKQKKVEMTYENNDGRASNRVFHVYSIFNRDKIAYVSGFCELRGEVRVFRISRIKKLTVFNETYSIPAYYKENSNMNRVFTFMEPHKALVELEQLVDTDTAALRMEYVEGKQYRLYFYNSDEIITYLFSLKFGFRIVAPNWLKEKLRHRLETIMRTNFLR